MRARNTRFAICIENRGAGDLEIHKLYRVLMDRDAAATGHLRVIDDSGEDYLYPSKYFVPVELSSEVQRALRRKRPTMKLRNSAVRTRRSALTSRNR